MDSKIKVFKSAEYNYIFRKDTGLFMRWGKTKYDDPSSAPAPEILDMEISTICNKGCSFCYKDNTSKGKNMSFSTFKDIFHKIPTNLTQIAFGIGDFNANKDLKKIFKYCRDNKFNEVIPNVTINGEPLQSIDYDFLVDTCGSIAVSLYDKNKCFNTVQELTNRGAKQVNIHILLSNENYNNCLETINNIKSDTRLANLGALVFLLIKPKGRASNLDTFNDIDKLNHIIDLCLKLDISYGFDSCSAPLFLKATEHKPSFEQIKLFIEPCESFLFSSYCDVNGEFYPCSFAPGTTNWETGISAIDSKDFIKDIWNNQKMLNWRTSLINSSKSCDCSIKGHCRNCPLFKLNKGCIDVKRNNKTPE